MATSTILEGLNPAQREAAGALEGAWLVVAGAGSGKTTVLSRRVAALIESGVDPFSILLLTFTRAAARNMLERAQGLCPEARDVNGGTFHSIAHRLVLENRTLFRLPEKLTILDPEDVASALRRISAARGGKEENMPKPSAVAKVISFATNTRKPIDEATWEKVPQFGYTADFIAECAEDYRSYKRERGLLDYDDLLVAWDKMLEHPEVGAAIRQRFRYVLVDEHQDSNALQCSIIDRLGGDAPNVMAVGDPAQSIYGFRGSAPRTMFAFLERWPDAKVVNLDVNYRSGPAILDVANAVDRSMSERFERQLVPAAGAWCLQPLLVTVDDLDAEARYIADRVLEYKENGTDLSEQAVLVRSMSAARHIEAEFVRRRIPYRVSGGIKISEAAHIKDLLCLARTAVNVLDEPAWMRVLTMARGIGDRKAAGVYAKLAEMAVDGIADPADEVERLFPGNPDISRIMDAWRMLSADGPPVEGIERALAVLDELFLQRYDDWRNRKGDVEAVAGIAERHDSIESFLAAVTLDHSVDRKVDVLGTDEEEAPITVSTVHSAKGLEWDVVFVPSFVEGHIPSIFAREREEIEEEKRILYVAVTRPRRSLHVVKPVVGRQYALAQNSRFEWIVSGALEHDRRASPRPMRSYNIGMEADIDIFG